MKYERIFVTVHYACTHYAARPIFRAPFSEEAPRLIGDDGKCQICRQTQTSERFMMPPHVPKYMIDGYAMHVFKDVHGYWNGQYSEGGKKIRKYFGKVDPRPQLEEISI